MDHVITMLVHYTIVMICLYSAAFRLGHSGKDIDSYS